MFDRLDTQTPAAEEKISQIEKLLNDISRSLNNLRPEMTKNAYEKIVKGIENNRYTSAETLKTTYDNLITQEEALAHYFKLKEFLFDEIESNLTELKKFPDYEEEEEDKKIFGKLSTQQFGIIGKIESENSSIDTDAIVKYFEELAIFSEKFKIQLLPKQIKQLLDETNQSINELNRLQREETIQHLTMKHEDTLDRLTYEYSTTTESPEPLSQPNDLKKLIQITNTIQQLKDKAEALFNTVKILLENLKDAPKPIKPTTPEETKNMPRQHPTYEWEVLFPSNALNPWTGCYIYQPTYYPEQPPIHAPVAEEKTTKPTVTTVSPGDTVKQRKEKIANDALIVLRDTAINYYIQKIVEYTDEPERELVKTTCLKNLSAIPNDIEALQTHIATLKTHRDQIFSDRINDLQNQIKSAAHELKLSKTIETTLQELTKAAQKKKSLTPLTEHLTELNNKIAKKSEPSLLSKFGLHSKSTNQQNTANATELTETAGKNAIRRGSGETK